MSNERSNMIFQYNLEIKKRRIFVRADVILKMSVRETSVRRVQYVVWQRIRDKYTRRTLNRIREYRRAREREREKNRKLLA